MQYIQSYQMIRVYEHRGVYHNHSAYVAKNMKDRSWIGFTLKSSTWNGSPSIIYCIQSVRYRGVCRGLSV
jgi:hypothetical protein